MTSEQLATPSYRSLLLIAGIWLLIGASILLSENLLRNQEAIWPYFLAVLVIGWTMLWLRNLTHRALHWTLFAPARANDALQFLYALPLFIDTIHLRPMHNWYHKEFKLYGDVERAGHTASGIPPGKLPASRFLLQWFVFPLLGHQGYFRAAVLIRRCIYAPNYRKRLFFYWSTLIVTFWIIGILDLLFWYWIVPFFSVYPVLFFWLETSRHYNTEAPYYTRDLHPKLAFWFFGGAISCYTAHMLRPEVPEPHLQRVQDSLVDFKELVIAKNFFELTKQLLSSDSQIAGTGADNAVTPQST